MGVPLGALSLITLTLQNSALTIVLHYVSTDYQPLAQLLYPLTS